MQQKQHINFKLPIFGWLFFLFLSPGISHYSGNLQFGKPVLIERVDRLISNSGKNKGVVKFSISSGKYYFSQTHNSQFLQINLLSQRLDNHIHILLHKQSCVFKLVSQNTILHLRSRNQAYNSSDNLPDLIS